MLINLLTNAIKFSPNNSIITIVGEIEEKRVVISVSDKGPGIALEKQSDVFDRFFMCDQESGTTFGLGLAICKMIIEAHRGEISVTQNEKAGSTFSIWLPIEPL